MSILIGNHSVSAVVRGYAHTRDGLIVWLELAPQHPKVVGAIRAELTSNTQRYMQLHDDEQGRIKMVYGLGRGYLNLTAEAPRISRRPAGQSAASAHDRPRSCSSGRPQPALLRPVLARYRPGDRAGGHPGALDPLSGPDRLGGVPAHQAMEDYDAEALVNGGQAPHGYAIRAGYSLGGHHRSGSSEPATSRLDGRQSTCFPQGAGLD